MPTEAEQLPPADADVFDGVSLCVESSRDFLDPSRRSLRSWLDSLGLPGYQWLIVDRVPKQEDWYFQVFRVSRYRYAVEIREGGASAHVAALVTGSQAVLDVFASWHREDGAWRTMADWSPPTGSVPEVDPDEDVRVIAEKVADRLLDEGFLARWQSLAAGLVHTLRDYGSDGVLDPEMEGVTLVLAQAERIAEPKWADRVAEQASWSGPTDCDALAAAFTALADEGIVARPTFEDCGSCGAAVIGGYLEKDSVGYVFFVDHDLESAIAAGRLRLRYGAVSDDGDAAAIGRRVVEQVRAAGLSVEWDGDPTSTIEVAMSWRKRLPTASDDGPWPDVYRF